MGSRARARQNLSMLVPVVGTSLMMVMAASGGYDEADDSVTVDRRELALV